MSSRFILSICIFLFLSSLLQEGQAQRRKRGQEEALINLSMKQIGVDGQLDEWPQPFAQLRGSMGVFMKVANNDEMLFVALRISDQALQQEIMQYGLTLSVDSLGKKRSKHFGLGFPLPLTEEQIGQLSSRAMSQDPMAIERAYGEISQEFDLINVVEETLRVSNLGSKEIKVQLGFDDLKALQIEYQIPLKRIWKRPLTGTEEARLILKVNEAPKSKEEEQSLFDDRSQMGNGVTQSNPLLGNGTSGMNSGMSNPMGRNQSMPSGNRGGRSKYSSSLNIKLQPLDSE